jgi:hypothetical protein
MKKKTAAEAKRQNVPDNSMRRRMKLIFSIFLLSAASIFYSQSKVCDSTYNFKPFLLSDTSICPGQVFEIYNLTFKVTNDSLFAISNETMDSLFSFLNKGHRFFIIYRHKRTKSEHQCKKVGWDRAVGIKRYLLSKGIPEKNILLLKSMCLGPDEQKNNTRLTERMTGFAQFYLLD